MNLLIWLILALLVLGLIVVVLSITLNKKKRTLPPDYYALFWVGLAWTVIGIPFENHALGMMGLIFMIVGLTNKDKWEKNRKVRMKLTKEQRKTRNVIKIVLYGLIVLTLILFLLAKFNILNFPF